MADPSNMSTHFLEFSFLFRFLLSRHANATQLLVDNLGAFLPHADCQPAGRVIPQDVLRSPEILGQQQAHFAAPPGGFCRKVEPYQFWLLVFGRKAKRGDIPGFVVFGRKVKSVFHFSVHWHLEKREAEKYCFPLFVSLLPQGLERKVKK